MGNVVDEGTFDASGDAEFDITWPDPTTGPFQVVAGVDSNGDGELDVPEYGRSINLITPTATATPVTINRTAGTTTGTTTISSSDSEFHMYRIKSVTPPAGGGVNDLNVNGQKRVLGGALNELEFKYTQAAPAAPRVYTVVLQGVDDSSILVTLTVTVI